jgi:hypothetical protein
MATGISRLLTENYGLRAEKLTEFGIQPFRGRKIKTADPETPPPVVETAGENNSGS